MKLKSNKITLRPLETNNRETLAQYKQTFNSYNETSKSVLEKCGYEFKGILKSITIKNNRFEDE